MASALATFVLLVLCCLACAPALAAAPSKTCERASATFYDYGSGPGACGFGPAFGTTLSWTQNVVAPSEFFYNSASECGICYEVTGPTGSTTVVVGDLCPGQGNENWCASSRTHFDFSSVAFPLVAKQGWGTSAINIHMVPCPVPGNVKLKVQASSSVWWLSLLVFDHKAGVKSLEIEESGTWYAAERQSYNFWHYRSNLQVGKLTLPVNVRVTSIFDETSSGTISTISDNLIISLGSQFSSFTPDPKCLTPLPYENVYLDGLDNTPAYGWKDWSSSISKTFADPRAASGKYCIHGILGGWKAWQFGRTPTVDCSWFTSIEFDLRSASSNVKNGLRVSLNDTDFPGVDISASNISAQWTHFTFSVSGDFSCAPGTTFQRIMVQNRGSDSVDLFIDNIHLGTAPAYVGNHYSAAGDAGGNLDGWPTVLTSAAAAVGQAVLWLLAMLLL